MQKLTVEITSLAVLLIIIVCIGTGVAQKSDEDYAQKVLTRIRAGLAIVFSDEFVKQYKDMCIKLYPNLEPSILEGYKEYEKRNTMIYAASAGYVIISSSLFGKEYSDMIDKKVKEEVAVVAKDAVRKAMGRFTEAKRKETCNSMRNDFITGVYDIEKAEPDSVRIMREEKQERARLRK